MLAKTKKWMAERIDKNLFTGFLQYSTLLEKGAARCASTQTGVKATQVRRMRASDVVTQTAVPAPNEGFEACHSETEKPLRNTPSYHEKIIERWKGTMSHFTGVYDKCLQWMSRSSNPSQTPDQQDVDGICRDFRNKSRRK